MSRITAAPIQNSTEDEPEVKGGKKQQSLKQPQLQRSTTTCRLFLYRPYLLKVPRTDRPPMIPAQQNTRLPAAHQAASRSYHQSSADLEAGMSFSISQPAKMGHKIPFISETPLSVEAAAKQRGHTHTHAHARSASCRAFIYSAALIWAGG